ncbi:hypothetical protein EV378_5707 [Pseudonocardia endophytica]|uniref:Uncharacterized protein n=1 Tax=Pseudonocardia endophytica TaxID=401976 RepID=A0A4V2PHQ7_PSEEN|nr:hypothetical protein EV378_5707 [Pseudonocardia endophytica]
MHRRRPGPRRRLRARLTRRPGPEPFSYGAADHRAGREHLSRARAGRAERSPSPAGWRGTGTPSHTHGDSVPARGRARADNGSARVLRISARPADQRASRGSERVPRISARPADQRAFRSTSPAAAGWPRFARRSGVRTPPGARVRQISARSTHQRAFRGSARVPTRRRQPRRAVLGSRAASAFAHLRALAFSVSARLPRISAPSADQRAFRGSGRVPRISTRPDRRRRPGGPSPVRTPLQRSHASGRSRSPYQRAFRGSARRPQISARSADRGASRGSARVPTDGAGPADRPRSARRSSVRTPPGAHVLRISARPADQHASRSTSAAAAGRPRFARRSGVRTPLGARVLRISARPADQRASRGSARVPRISTRPADQHASRGSARVPRISTRPADQHASRGSARLPRIGALSPDARAPIDGAGPRRVVPRFAR